jgi:DNA gyrase subunit B
VLKEKDANLTGDDVREGLTAIVSVKLGEPQFEGQTKTKLGNTEAKSFVQKVVNEQLGDLVRAEPDRGQGHRPQGVQQAASRASPPARRATSPARARACWSRRRLPASSPTASRRPRGVRGLHRRGRLGRRLGQGRARPTDPGDPADPRQDPQRREGAHRPVLQNNEVQALITALGTGIHDDFDLAKLRYHKIILMADADVDGQHIRTLLLTLLFRFMRPLVEPARLPGPASAVQDQVEPTRPRVRLLRPGARRAGRGREARRRAKAAQGRRPSSATRVWAR